jgi:hypothetical protein
MGKFWVGNTSYFLYFGQFGKNGKLGKNQDFVKRLEKNS